MTTNAPTRALVVHVWLALSRVLLWNPVFPSPGPLSETAAETDDACRDAGTAPCREPSQCLADDRGPC
jgi:hypothetical protein